MKTSCLTLSALLVLIQLSKAQSTDYSYAASVSRPFGMLNPDAPAEVADYAQLIGLCDCQSYSKNKEGLWAAPVDMTWTFKYIMNGHAVQDETLKEDSSHSGSIRVFSQDSARWYVHYYANKKPTAKLSTWEGGTKEDEIILYNRQKAPNGINGFYKIRFHDISEQGFKWLGVWTTLDESFTLETWKIECKKRL